MVAGRATIRSKDLHASCACTATSRSATILLVRSPLGAMSTDFVGGATSAYLSPRRTSMPRVRLEVTWSTM